MAYVYLDDSSLPGTWQDGPHSSFALERLRLNAQQVKNERGQFCGVQMLYDNMPRVCSVWPTAIGPFWVYADDSYSSATIQVRWNEIDWSINAGAPPGDGVDGVDLYATAITPNRYINRPPDDRSQWTTVQTTYVAGTAGTTTLTVDLTAGYRGWLGFLVWIWSYSQEETTAVDIDAWHGYGLLEVDSLGNMEVAGPVLYNPPERAAIVKSSKGGTEDQIGPARQICYCDIDTNRGIYVEPPLEAVALTTLSGTSTEVDYWTMGVMVLEGVSVRLNATDDFAVGEWSFLTDEPIQAATHQGLVREVNRLTRTRTKTWMCHPGLFKYGAYWLWWPQFAPNIGTEIGTSYVEVAGGMIADPPPAGNRTGFNLIMSMFITSNVQTSISRYADWTFKVEAIELDPAVPAAPNKDAHSVTPTITLPRNNEFTTQSAGWWPGGQNIWNGTHLVDAQLRGHIIEPAWAGLGICPRGDLYRIQNVELEFDDIDLSTVSYPLGIRVSMKNAVAADTEFNTVTILSLGVASKPWADIEWHIESFLHSDFTAAAQSEQVALTGFPTAVDVMAGYLYVDTLMSGGGTTSCDAEVGDALDPNGLLTSTDVFTGAGTGWKHADGAESGRHTEAAFTPAITLTVDAGHTVADLSSGKIWVAIAYTES